MKKTGSCFCSCLNAANNWNTYPDRFRALEHYTVSGTVTGEPDETNNLRKNRPERKRRAAIDKYIHWQKRYRFSRKASFRGS